MPGESNLPAVATASDSIFNNTQVRVAIYTSFFSTALSIGMQHLVNGTMSLYYARHAPNPADFQVADEAYRAGLHYLEKEHNYTTALKEFKFAKEHFEKSLHKYTTSNRRLHQLYTDVCYNQALTLVYCGDFSAAEKLLVELEAQLTQWKIKRNVELCCDVAHKAVLDQKDEDLANHKDEDIFNLKALIHLKQGKKNLAFLQFEQSLKTNPNQPEIVFLNTFTAVDQNNEKGISTADRTLFLTNPELFRPKISHPVAFEVNLAHLQSLYDDKQYGLCIEKAKILERVYVAMRISYKDRHRIYNLIILALTALKPSLDEKTAPAAAMPAANFPMALFTPPSPPSSLPRNQVDADKEIKLYANKLNIEARVAKYGETKALSSDAKQATYKPHPVPTASNDGYSLATVVTVAAASVVSGAAIMHYIK